jgi:hypothetical protein
MTLSDEGLDVQKHFPGKNIPRMRTTVLEKLTHVPGKNTQNYSR